MREHRYWRFAIEADEHAPDDRIPALAEELRALLDRAVMRRLVSDVPLGIFLSGGIDSSHRARAGRAPPRRPRDSTRSPSASTKPSFDETPYARAVAAAIGTRHHERILDFDTARDLAAQVLARLDEPTGDASILPTYLLCAFARETVTVALSGDGGDELFAGYDPFAALAPAAWYDRLVPQPVHLLLRRMTGDAAARHHQHEPRLQAAPRADGAVLSAARAPAGLDVAARARADGRAVRRADADG